MIRVGVLDDDPSLARSMAALWDSTIEVSDFDLDREQPERFDVLVVDAASVSGHALTLLSRLRLDHPDLKIVVTLVYCDETQVVESRLRELADLCVLKPYDVEKLGQSIRYLMSEVGGA